MSSSLSLLSRSNCSNLPKSSLPLHNGLDTPFHSHAGTLPGLKLQQEERLNNFISALKDKLDLQNQKNIEPPSLYQILQIVMSEANPKIKQALIKNEGYFNRLFSAESWTDWTENKTALGKVINIFSAYLGNDASLASSIKVLNLETIQQAEKEAAALLKTKLLLERETKKGVESPSYFEPVWETFSSLDKRITSLLPLPQGVSAQPSLTNLPFLGTLALTSVMPVTQVEAGWNPFKGAGLLGNLAKAIFSPADYLMPTDSIEQIIEKAGETGERIIWKAGDEVRLTLGTAGDEARSTVGKNWTRIESDN